MAREAGLPVADKPDSQEICFIPDGDYRKFISERVPPKPGLMVDVNKRSGVNELLKHSWFLKNL